MCVFTCPCGKIGKKVLKKKPKIISKKTFPCSPKDFFILVSSSFPRKVNAHFDVHGISLHNRFALVRIPEL